MSLQSSQQEKADQRENQQLFPDPSDNSCHKANRCPENWKAK